MTSTHSLIDSVFEVCAAIRYVAVCDRGHLASRQRASIEDASSCESDHYEELLVNPTLLTLARARGEIDCGGLQFIVVRYGNFFQLIMGDHSRHLSVCFDHTVDPNAYAETIQRLHRQHL